jgi:hypothetical protein
MEVETRSNRRSFVAGALAAIGTVANAIEATPAPEVPNFATEVPPGATLRGVIVFMADEPIEITVGRGSSIKPYRGRFDEQQIVQYEWHNASNRPERVLIRAKALAGERELPPTRVEFLSRENVYVGFGRRAAPADELRRRGGYPFDAVFVGFFIFGAQHA